MFITYPSAIEMVDAKECYNSAYDVAENKNVRCAMDSLSKYLPDSWSLEKLLDHALGQGFWA